MYCGSFLLDASFSVVRWAKHLRELCSWYQGNYFSNICAAVLTHACWKLCFLSWSVILTWQQKCVADDFICSLSSNENNRSACTQRAVICFHQHSQSLAPLWAAVKLPGCITANYWATHVVFMCCSGLRRFWVQFYLNIGNPPYISVSLTAEGQRTILKVLQLFLA